MKFRDVYVYMLSSALLMGLSMSTLAAPALDTQDLETQPLKSVGSKLEAGELENIRSLYYDSLTNAASVDRGLAFARASTEIVQPLRIAYEGSFLCLQARDSLWPLRKWNRAQEGLQLLDKAVAVSPDSVEVRVLRAAVTAHLPSFFGRSSQAEKDLDWIEETRNTGRFYALAPKLQQFVQNFMKSVKRG